jgi:putative transposase
MKKRRISRRLGFAEHQRKRRHAMKIDVSVPEVVELFKEIQKTPEKLFEMMRLDIREIAGEYLTSLMDAELTIHLGRDRYKRCRIEVNHRNGSYPRQWTASNQGKGTKNWRTGMRSLLEADAA